MPNIFCLSGAELLAAPDRAPWLGELIGTLASDERFECEPNSKARRFDVDRMIVFTRDCGGMER